MIDSEFYKTLTDEGKSRAIQLAYIYAGHLAAEEVTDGKHESDRYVELAQTAKRELGLSEAEYLLLCEMHGKDMMNSDALREAYDAGIEIDDFITYKNAAKGITADRGENGETISGSKKAKIISEIDALDIPAEGKDYLYLAAGYAESGLQDVPWR